MKWFLYLICLLFASIAYAQEVNLEVSLDTFRFVQDRLYQHYDKESYTGFLVRNFENGVKQFEIPYVNGIPVGKYMEWYENGNLKVVGTYNEDGIETGEFKKWDKDGRLEIIGYFKNGAYDSTWVFYYPNGVLSKEAYYTNGKRDNTWRFWTEDEELYYIEKYKNDTLIQKEKLFDYFPIEQ